MRYIVIVSMLVLSACAKQADVQGGAEIPTYSWGLKSIPANCTQTASGTHSFVEWGALQAKTYSCTETNDMDCTLAVTDGYEQVEMICQSKSGQTASVPSACKSYSEGAHQWLDDGSITATTAYDCNVWNSALRCFFFQDQTGNKREMRCLDTELP